MQEMRIVPELAGYDELLETLFFELMDDKLQTPEEMKAFLEPFSPPAPPPPVSTRRPRAPKKESKAKARAKKAIVVDAGTDGDGQELTGELEEVLTEALESDGDDAEKPGGRDDDEGADNDSGDEDSGDEDEDVPVKPSKAPAKAPVKAAAKSAGAKVKVSEVAPAKAPAKAAEVKPVPVAAKKAVAVPAASRKAPAPVAPAKKTAAKAVLVKAVPAKESVVGAKSAARPVVKAVAAKTVASSLGEEGGRQGSREEGSGKEHFRQSRRWFLRKRPLR